MPAFDGDDLAGDFGRGEVAFPSVETGGAEAAAIGASDLGGDTEGVTVGTVAVEGGIGGDQDAFDEGAVVESPEELLGGVGGALFLDEFKGAEGPDLGEAGAEGLWQVGHFVPGDGAPGPEPMKELIHPVDGFGPFGETGDQGVAGFLSDIRQHAGDAMGSGVEGQGWGRADASPVAGQQFEYSQDVTPLPFPA